MRHTARSPSLIRATDVIRPIAATSSSMLFCFRLSAAHTPRRAFRATVRLKATTASQMLPILPPEPCATPYTALSRMQMCECRCAW
jgi:hypothetical protein